MTTDEKVPDKSSGSEDGEYRLISGEKNVKIIFDYKNDLKEREGNRDSLWLLTT